MRKFRREGGKWRKTQTDSAWRQLAETGNQHDVAGAQNAFPATLAALKRQRGEGRGVAGWGREKGKLVKSISQRSFQFPSESRNLLDIFISAAAATNTLRRAE